MLKYRVTVVSLGLGFGSAETLARKCEEHLAEMAAEGWRLVHADRNSFAIPCYWTFIWERQLGPGSEEADRDSDMRADRQPERGSSSFGVKPA